MRLLPALRKRVSNDSPTFLSLSVKPGRSAEDSLLPYLGESAEIHHASVDRRCVDFEVARVDDSTALAADSESECIGYGMVDMDSLNGKAAEGYHIAGLDDIE